jgi:hypothetical protein
MSGISYSSDAFQSTFPRRKRSQVSFKLEVPTTPLDFGFKTGLADLKAPVLFDIPEIGRETEILFKVKHPSKNVIRSFTKSFVNRYVPPYVEQPSDLAVTHFHVSTVSSDHVPMTGPQLKQHLDQVEASMKTKIEQNDLLFNGASLSREFDFSERSRRQLDRVLLELLGKL